MNLTTWTAKTLIITFSLYGLIYYFLFSAKYILLICLLAAFSIILSLFFKKYLMSICVLAMYFITFGCSHFSGGLQSPILFWVCPIFISCSYLNYSNKKQFYILILFSILFIFLEYNFEFPNEIESKYTSLIHVMALFGMTLCSFLMGSEFIKLNKLKLANELQNKQLKTMKFIIKGINHEFGNVLNVIINGVRGISLKVDNKEFDRINFLCSEIKESAFHADNIIKSFKNVDSKKEKEKFNLNEVIDTCLNLSRGIYMEKIKIINKIEKDIFINSNKTSVFQAILNIFLNAVEANAKNIEFSGCENGEYYLLKIIDDGKGILNKNDLFNEGFSSKESDGIGLTITKNNLNELEIDLYLESLKNPTIFTIKFPMKENIE